MTDTIDFVHKYKVSKGKDVTYTTFVLDYRLLKSEPQHVHITVCGDRLLYVENAGPPAVSMLKMKILVNNTISDAHNGARFMSTC